MYEIRFVTPRVERRIAALPTPVRRRVFEAIERLAREPRPAGVRKLSGEMRGFWRVRVGDYRIVYDIDAEQRLVSIAAVHHRRESYR